MSEVFRGLAYIIQHIAKHVVLFTVRIMLFIYVQAVY